ncbi:hypothetical protein AVEN_156274-1 [Araneus ventricosus]|uniref:Uncharacterized protein n=1 Tax=Araneus ventricosus TaxID=182803 RepID=A0A4Y2ELQ3_ARAVE|nr:hypothetical protein AVEN_257205-1 [Araneus ventricosus]GBM30169.1 hypothetical protein AVEN_156274-1 [Araneus ventricosus]
MCLNSSGLPGSYYILLLMASDRPLLVLQNFQAVPKEFEEQIIGYGGYQELPPRSPDLAPMDFFLWGYLKQQVYATPPPALQDLQRRITDACANVTPTMLHRVQRKVQARVQMCIVAFGEKFEHRK